MRWVELERCLSLASVVDKGWNRSPSQRPFFLGISVDALVMMGRFCFAAAGSVSVCLLGLIP